MINKITKEIQNYKSETVNPVKGYSYSQYKTVHRIMLIKNQVYAKGKLDEQGKIKFWFDIITPRVDNEIKNIDFDTKNISLFSLSKKDAISLFIANFALKEWLRKTGESAKLNEFIEIGSEWGNVVWKKIKDGYEVMDLNDFFVLNQTAKTLENSDIIERHLLTRSQLLEKKYWKNVDELIKAKDCKEFLVYERNGEVTEKELRVAQNKSGGSEDKYVLAKIVVGGIKKDISDDIKYVLYAEEIPKMPYKEYHRGKYAGRWLRMGLVEALYDCQIRANQIGNQIARGLEWSSKTIFRSSDRTIARNILTDMKNGDIIKSEDLQQVNTRMNGIDQLIADWNRIMEIADKIANSYEVVTGETMPSGTPFSLGNMLNQNANKLFDYIREKLGIAFEEIIQDWILPDIMKDLRGKDVIRITGDAGYLKKFYQLLVKSWYLNNLIAMPPHGEDVAMAMKEEKLKELLKNKEIILKLEKKMWENIRPRVMVVITGENIDMGAELETLKTFIALEGDSLRRTALIEMAMIRRGIDVSDLPKTPPEMMMKQVPQAV